jgi:hypothetical protein
LLGPNEEQVSRLRRWSVERNKQEGGFERFRWRETKEGDAVDDACLTIEIGAEFRFPRTLAELGQISEIAVLFFQESLVIPDRRRAIIGFAPVNLSPQGPIRNEDIPSLVAPSSRSCE